MAREAREERLHAFIGWWRENCDGREKSEAQDFIREFLTALGYQRLSDAEGQFEVEIRIRRNGGTQIKWADFVIPGLVIIEMKSRGSNLSHHYDQLYEYWEHLVPKRPQYAILCNFDEFWIYDFNHQLYDPMDMVRVEDLPSRQAALSFLLPKIQRQTPVFGNNLVAVTQEAAKSLAEVFKILRKDAEYRQPLKREAAQGYILQCMLSFFAEDIGLLPPDTFTRIIDECINQDASAYDLVTLLFQMMNTKGKKSHGRFRGVDYFNGGLFEVIEPIELFPTELRLMKEASKPDWAKIRPAIFGTIFEDSLSDKERHQIGAHFTKEVDIKKVVDPVIVRPWRDRIEAADSVETLVRLQRELSNYQVLDPACGSGNFLYIAYRELKKLEMVILNAIREKRGDLPPKLPLVSTHQFWGFDINPFAVELAKVTLMIAKKFAVDEFASPESPLPLDNLNSNIRVADALFETWPAFDACIGNPPYMGAKRLKQERGASYVNEVRQAFPDIPGNADYCVYWFRKAHDLMKPGSRAGLVGTNTIRQNYSRYGGLDYIVANDGHIFEAISSMPWSGEAAVHVSIACWSKGNPPTPNAHLYYYNEQNGEESRNGNGNGNGDEDQRWRMVEMETINSSLSENTDVSGAVELACNIEPKCVFQGQTPGHNGFVLRPVEAQRMFEADPRNQDVVRPYLIGRDLLEKWYGQPSRYIIDFAGRSMVEARNYTLPYAHIQKKVLPDRKKKAKAEDKKNLEALAANPKAKVNRHHQHALHQWWLHIWGRLERKTATEHLSRYIVCSRVTKRPVFAFVSPEICPGDSLQTFAFEDDYSFGILQSNMHWVWFTEKASTLKSDFRYTPESVFDTFPWPQHPSNKDIEAVVAAARELQDFLRRTMNASKNNSYRYIYQSLELPGKNPLFDLHEKLDRVVLKAYSFDVRDDILAQLLALNGQVAARIEAGEIVTSPGVPPQYPQLNDLVREGCIQPPELI